MSCPSDWGFFDRMTTGPADVVAVDFTYASPLSATSISTTCPPAALETADDTAAETADDTPADTAGVVDDDVAPDEPHPAVSTRIAKPLAVIHLKAVGIPRTLHPRLRGFGARRIRSSSRPSCRNGSAEFDRSPRSRPATIPS